jgi:caa(3)-type oxidase subunit IV
MAQSQHPNYKKIYLTLLVLLVISVAGPFLGIKWVTLITAFGIAVVKADLVIQNFMHLKWERRIMKWTLAVSLVLMFLFFFGVAPDVMRHTGRNWVNDAAFAATARGIPAPHGEEHAAEGVATTAAPTPAGTDGHAAAEPAFDARGAYMTMCVTCHGPAGHGDGPGAAALNPRPADFSDPAFWAGKPDAELVRAIREGGAAVGRSPSMPPWGSLYSETQAGALVAYLKTLRRQPR